ncbi:hypothetical protein DXA13_15505 [Clostridium sp. AM58-1XD]|nr:hypothetical protein DXA13_15505 [Clostridium sp. AM58-1XD]
MHPQSHRPEQLHHNYISYKTLSKNAMFCTIKGGNLWK